MKIPEAEGKNQKKFLDLKIIPFEPGTTNSHHTEQDTCHWQSMFYELLLRFKISLREIFFKSRSLGMTGKYDESDLMMISQEFGTL